MAEDSGTFKTNPAKSRQIAGLSNRRTAVASKPHLAKKPLSQPAGSRFRQFVINGPTIVAVLSNRLIRCALASPMRREKRRMQ
jgi:hypothetical protein